MYVYITKIIIRFVCIYVCNFFIQLLRFYSSSVLVSEHQLLVLPHNFSMCVCVCVCLHKHIYSLTPLRSNYYEHAHLRAHTHTHTHTQRLGVYICVFVCVVETPSDFYLVE